MQRYFYREVRGNTSQLIRRLAMRLLNPEKAPKQGDAKAQERLELWLHELDEQLLEKLNDQLQSSKYLTGNAISVVDFIFYCEINQVRMMYDRELPQHLTKLHEWYEEVGDIEALKEVSGELKKVIDEYSQLKEQSQ